ncbi:hypothetical protein ACQP2T_22660 [Nonomuraea sp. CA-143628]|uniref:hypothetical protein n=1 Tax=Nonomuraea sp. CA-143628 TaxID=3239997 RepID=UPI003D8FBA0F
MRRHRFGRIAAAFAMVYLAAVVVLAVVVWVTGDITPLWVVVADRSGFAADDLRPWWWLVVLLVLIAAVQAWAYWQVLRGRERGEPARHSEDVRLLRAVLYVSVGYDLLLLLPIPYVWWLTLISGLIQLVTAWLFFRVPRGTTPRWLRLIILMTGMLHAVYGLATAAISGLGVGSPAWMAGLLEVGELIWPAWAISVLVAQARDPRWSRTTVRIGVVAVVVSLLRPSSLLTFSYPSEVPWDQLVYELLGALSVLGLVWWARSAHDLGSLMPPAPRPRSVRAPARRWPLPVVAIVLPLIPAAVNLAHGMPFWLGPTNALWNIVQENSSSELIITWYALDLLVGVGLPSLLILAAVGRRTRRLVRATTLSLYALAVVAAVSAFAETAQGPLVGEVPLYPDSLFVKDGALVSTGISPLWYGLALITSALILTFLYAVPSAHRGRRHVLVAGIASAVALCLLPAADQARGPATTTEECHPPPYWEQERPEPAPELTAEQRFVCALRGQGTGLARFADTTPDQVVLAYGRRLCDLHTRNDPRELARWKIDRNTLTYSLAGICPSAAAVVKAARAEQDQEIAEMRAEAQRMCDATPRHRPRIKPVTATRIKEPQMTDYGVLQTYENEDGDPDLDPGNGLVSSEPGTLTVITSPDFDLCVTVETYPRRPPVETKGWDTVVEVGYRSSTGEIVLSDDVSGTELPDLSLNGRAGHYRIRVHYAWFPWKGEGQGGQRLLIMAYPAPGDKEAVYRK